MVVVIVNNFFLFLRGYASVGSLSRARLRVACLVVSFLLEPASWVSTEVESSRLVVNEDGEHEGQGRQPPDESRNNRKIS